MDFYSVASSRPFTHGQISWWTRALKREGTTFPRPQTEVRSNPNNQLKNLAKLTLFYQTVAEHLLDPFLLSRQPPHDNE